ncbi:MAG: murein biosynthesis integral membrane protein MurJ [Acidobacteriota bacterium]|nr:murein biosynthesis integral membrane protein MurJ [Acidobacteriota bacterium]
MHLPDLIIRFKCRMDPVHSSLQVRIRISRLGKASEPGNDPAGLNPSIASELTAELTGPSRPALGGSSRVALGILLSRITGLIRERVLGHYFGDSAILGIFRAAFRIPNLLSNLFGEGVLSAAFVTVYAKIRAQEQDKEAQELAAAVFSILACVSSVIVLLGVLLTPVLIDLIAPGFHGEDRALTIRLVRILFPAAGMLVMSAWCLGVLNSHRKFLLSYSAPMAMNGSMVAALTLFARYLPQQQSIVLLAWACVIGSILQFLVQLPGVLRFLPRFRPIIDLSSAYVRAVIRNFVPVFVSRGVVQISAYVDQMIASFLGPVAISALSYGQFIAFLPISLFSMSVSAAELPELSSAIGERAEVAAQLRTRLTSGLRRIAFFIIPCAVAFLINGDVLIAALYQGGRFHYSDALYVWSVLAGASVGLLATSLGRLYSSVFYALHETRTPLRFALIRVAVTTVLGLIFAFPLPRWLGIDPKWGVAGLTASAGIAGWLEFSLLRHSLAGKIGATPLPFELTAKLWSVSLIAAALGFSLKATLGTRHPLPLAIIIISLYCAVYFGGTALLGVPESRQTLKSVFRRLRLGM